jgi:hypothetical protein
MMRYTTYFSDILCLPSGRVLTVSTRATEELRKNDLIKWKRNIEMSDEKINIHGYVCKDKDIEKIEEIDKRIVPFNERR